MLTVRINGTRATLAAIEEYVQGEIAKTQEAMHIAMKDGRTEPARIQLVGRLEAYLSVLRRLADARDGGKSRRPAASPSPSWGER